MSSEHIKTWQKIIGETVDGDFGPVTLATSKKVAEKAGILQPEPKPIPGKYKGEDFIKLALTRVGEKYVYGADVDLNDPDYHGDWDCAEYVTWVVKQITGKIYGCVDNGAKNPDPYTGGWRKDVLNGTVINIPVSQAAKTKGGILLRFRAGSKHIVFALGDGKTTVEAKGAAYGVCKGVVGNLSNWDYGILIPSVDYN